MGPAAASERGPGWEAGTLGCECRWVGCWSGAGEGLGLGVGEWARGAPPEVCSTSISPAPSSPSPSPRALGVPRSDPGLQVTNSARLLLRLGLPETAHPSVRARVKQCADDLNLTVLCGRRSSLPPTAGRRWRLRVKSGAPGHTGWVGLGRAVRDPAPAAGLPRPALLPCLRSPSGARPLSGEEAVDCSGEVEGTEALVGGEERGTGRSAGGAVPALSPGTPPPSGSPSLSPSAPETPRRTFVTP